MGKRANVLQVKKFIETHENGKENGKTPSPEEGRGCHHCGGSIEFSEEEWFHMKERGGEKPESPVGGVQCKRCPHAERREGRLEKGKEEAQRINRLLERKGKQVPDFPSSPRSLNRPKIQGKGRKSKVIGRVHAQETSLLRRSFSGKKKKMKKNSSKNVMKMRKR